MNAHMQQDDDNIQSDAGEFADNMAQATAVWQQIIQRLAVGTFAQPTQSLGHADPFHIQAMFMQYGSKLLENPEALQAAQTNLWQEHMTLWQEMTEQLLGKSPPHSPIKDRRFRDEAWDENSYFDYLRRSYLINSQWLEKSVEQVEGLDAHTVDKLSFFTRQINDAMSPSNFMMTNPQVMRETLERNGANLVHGLENMLQDIERGDGKLRISMTDEDAFSLGENIAATKGEVVYENDLMQLIQYHPTTEKVFETPLLFVPAWINKYYILDLQEENSVVKWALDQGYSVFVISWVNPDASLKHKSFEHYLSDGPLSALDVIEDITGCDHTNIVAYCLGGTLTASMLAYLHAHGEQDRVGAVSYLTTMIDFTNAGDLSVFIDEEQIETLEDRMDKTGYLEADDMAMTFSMLRSNDLIWSFFINNYLLGKDPFPFDILYWNSDATRMPAAMHSFYLRTMYQKNNLIQAGVVSLLDTPIDLSEITTPTYLLSTKEDHIAPWKSTYAATTIYSGDITFTLAESGHVAGVVNPPHKKKYGYWNNETLSDKPEEWLENATYQKASWWLHWHAWNKKLSGKKIKARKVGNKRYAPIESAPGRYAKKIF